MADHEARGGTLILGGGFAGSYVARYLGKRGATIVSPENYMRFTPMEPRAVRLSDGDRILTSTIVWTAGVRAHRSSRRSSCRSRRAAGSRWTRHFA